MIVGMILTTEAMTVGAQFSFRNPKAPLLPEEGWLQAGVVGARNRMVDMGM